jgi:hypothetical protein
MSEETVNIDEDAYIKNNNSNESMFYDIVHLYRLKDKTTNNLKKIIFQFCYKTLANEKIVSKGDNGAVENHHNYVKRVTAYLDNCQNILSH